MTSEVLGMERAIGYHIHRIMQKKNVSIEQIASKLQMPEIRIKAIITGSTDIHEEEMNVIAGELGVDKDELLQSVSDDEMKDYNIHYMGKATNSADMRKIMDKVDMYVRLLNIQTNN